MSPRACQSTALQDKLKLEKPSMTYANLRSEAAKNLENFPPASSVNHQKQQVERAAMQREELVKFMSNVPSYLEKGENRKEKALNVGVLDWRRLEKWKYNNKPMSLQSSRCSPSSSNSSIFSTDESPTRSSRGHDSSPVRQRMRRPSLQSHLISSPKEGNSQGVKNITEDVGKFEDLKAASGNPLKGQQSIFRMYQYFSRNQSEIKLKECRRKEGDPQIIPKVETSLDLKSYGVASRSKGKTKIQDGEDDSGLQEFQELCSDVHRKYHERSKTILPRDKPESSHSAEKNRRSISEGSFSKELYNGHRYSDIPHSCPLPCEAEDIEDSRIKRPSCLDANSIKVASEPSQPSPHSVKLSISPSRGKNLEEKSNTMLRNSTATKSSGGPDLKNATAEAPKSRNPSPTRRFINGLGRIGLISSSKDTAEHVTAKAGLVSKSVADKPVASCLEDSSNKKPHSRSRSQSSPLRRLLEPLLKPKAANSHQCAEPSEQDPASVDRVCKSSDGRVESPTVHPVKARLDFSGCKTVEVDDSLQNKKQGSSTVQALLQIVIKNGLPLFTFAVDHKNDILAATMRKDEKCWIYTFFTVHELKKRHGWINQGGKAKSCGYVPNAVAQMTVSDSLDPNLATQNSVDELSVREFVLFAVDLKQADQHISNLQANDELAAIVVKFPKEITRSLNKDEKKSDCCNDPSMIGLGEPLPDMRKRPSSMENLENGSAVRSQDLLSTTVILPGGFHGLPSKGEPSPLIKRWISGGVCDCGGWDVGCRLRVLVNQTKLGRRPSSAKTHNAADRFELFSQGEALDDTPVFSLSTFKDGIFSVEFSSSLSFLQAFSICIAVLNSKKPYELSELSKLFEGKSSKESTFVVDDGMKPPNQVQPEGTDSYASYPPLSPIGRV